MRSHIILRSPTTAFVLRLLLFHDCFCSTTAFHDCFCSTAAFVLRLLLFYDYFYSMTVFVLRLLSTTAFVLRLLLVHIVKIGGVFPMLLYIYLYVFIFNFDFINQSLNYPIDKSCDVHFVVK